YVVPKIPSCHPVTSLCWCRLSQGQTLSSTTNNSTEAPTVNSTIIKFSKILNIRLSPSTPLSDDVRTPRQPRRRRKTGIPSEARDLLCRSPEQNPRRASVVPYRPATQNGCRAATNSIFTPGKNPRIHS